MTDVSAWPALVLTAGLATRLRPLSDIRAKAALPVAGTPLVARVLQWLRAAGVRHVVLNLHHRPETITRVVGDGSEWDLHVRYSWEPNVLGSAGGPRRALPLLDAKRFLIVNGDTITNCDLNALTRQHVETEALVTMAVVPGDVARYGGVVANRDGIVQGFSRAESARHFIGVQAVESDVFSSVPDNTPYETIRQLYPALIAQQPGTVRAYSSHAEFLDVGTPTDYLETVKTVAAREGKALDRGHRVAIAPTARVQDSVLWDRVSIGAHAELTDCIVTDDVVVPSKARYARVVLTTTDGAVVATPLTP
jgi:mannose-1-phosphate guanylyltransferase